MMYVLLLVTAAIPVAGFIAFGSWMRRRTGLTDEQAANAWELFLKGITALTAVVAGVIGVMQFLDTRHRELEHDANDLAQRTREFNVKLYEQAGDKFRYEFILYNEASDVAATLASSTDLRDPDVVVARKRFERLYWGQMSIMEQLNRERTRPVEEAMINFREAVVLWERTGKRDEDESSEKNLKRLSLYLAHACGKALRELSTTDAKSLPVSTDPSKAASSPDPPH
jgi:hypothetical protein